MARGAIQIFLVKTRRGIEVPSPQIMSFGKVVFEGKAFAEGLEIPTMSRCQCPPAPPRQWPPVPRRPCLLAPPVPPVPFVGSKAEQFDVFLRRHKGKTVVVTIILYISALPIRSFSWADLQTVFTKSRPSQKSLYSRLTFLAC